MKTIHIIILIIILFLLKKGISQHIRCGCSEYSTINQKEYFLHNNQTVDRSKTNLAGLSREDIQDLKRYDLSKIDWTKIDDYTYAQIVCIVQGCDTRPIIKNLPISSPN